MEATGEDLANRYRESGLSGHDFATLLGGAITGRYKGSSRSTVDGTLTQDPSALGLKAELQDRFHLAEGRAHEIASDLSRKISQDHGFQSELAQSVAKDASDGHRMSASLGLRSGAIGELGQTAQAAIDAETSYQATIQSGARSGSEVRIGALEAGHRMIQQPGSLDALNQALDSVGLRGDASRLGHEWHQAGLIQNPDQSYAAAGLALMTGHAHPVYHPLSEEEAVKLLDAVLDWRDPDSLKRPFGAEEAEYTQAGLKGRPANFPFQSTEEMQLVLGMRPEVFQRIAPMITLVPAFAIWAVMPLDPSLVIADIDAGLLYVLSLTSVGVYGVILAGWASNSKYAFLGAMRSAAQIVAYEIAMGFALVGVVMAAGTLNLGDIVRAQSGGITHWFLIWLFPLFVVYVISGVAETNRAPFDVAEGESEIVAGFHVEYSGIAFALFFLAEYANMILISALTAVFFLGGWLSPFEGVLAADNPLAVPGFHWLFAKLFFFLTCFMWYRATFPRYRYDQIMRLGWKVLIPVTLVWIAAEALMVHFGVGPWSTP